MRLGSYDCRLVTGSLAARLYGTETIRERHRHRYEVNNQYRAQLEAAGLLVSGINTELNLVEMVELTDHPYFIACQFHPEFQSKPFAPHPLFAGFVRSAVELRDKSTTPVAASPSVNVPRTTFSAEQRV